MNDKDFDRLTDAYCARVAARIREIRTEKKMSIIRLAEDAHMTQSMIFYLESGERTPTIGTLYRVATALGTTPEQLLIDALAEKPARRDALTVPAKPKAAEKKRK